MTLIVDAAPLVAFANKNDTMHAAVRRTIEGESVPLVIPAPVTAEIDYMLGVRLGARARRGFMGDLAAGRYSIACLDRTEHGAALEVDARYADLDLGLADSAIVVVARRFATNQLLTFDHRHFRAVRPLDGSPAFVLLPADG